VRRLTEAREALVSKVKDNLKSAIGVADQDFMSVVRVVHSQIDLRLSMALKDTAKTN
jgi:hypothetical protein